MSLKFCPLKLTGMGQPWCFKIPLIGVAINVSLHVTEGMEGSYPWRGTCTLDGFDNLPHLVLFCFWLSAAGIILNQNLNFRVHLSESFTYRFINTQYFTVSQLLCTTRVGSRVCLNFFKFSFFMFYIQIPLPVCFRAM